MALLQAGEGALAEAANRAVTAPRHPLESVKLLPVLPRPGKIICLGLNYAEHAAEGGRERPDYPNFFMRGATTLIGHGAPVIRPRVSVQLDFEAELAAVIGRRVPRHVAKTDALSFVAGYACFNDVSVRDYQRRTPQWTIGKNFDGTGPFGPAFVTADELPPGASGLHIRSRLNGKVMQSANTRDMLFPVDETIMLLAQCLTLEPGDVLVMGTAGRRWLRADAASLDEGRRHDRDRYRRCRPAFKSGCRRGVSGVIPLPAALPLANSSPYRRAAAPPASPG